MSVIAAKPTARATVAPDDETLAKQAAEASRVLSVLANESRLLILCYLMMRKEMKVGDLVDAVKLSQSALSQHLTKLREEGLVDFRGPARSSSC